MHYHTGYYAFATEVVKVGEVALEVIHELLGHELRDKIELVVSDDTDDANGTAQILPYPIVRAFVTAPDDLSFLSEHRYWVYELIAHELTHIVHLDTTGGLPKVVNTIFGRTYMPNQLQARFFIEGLAVEVESRLSQGGRARSRFVDMVLRAEAVEDYPLRFDQALSGPYRWPQGNSWYLHGGRFLSYVAARFGQDKLREISRRYGAALIPFAMNRAFRAVIGRSYDDVWAEFQAELQAGYASDLAKVQADPLVEGRALTTRGQRNYNPRYAPDGRIFYFAQGYSLIPSLRAIDPVSGDDRELDKITADAQLSRPEDNGHVLLSQFEVWRTFYRYQDLFDYDWRRGRFRRLTTGMRARDPAISRDGMSVFFIQNLGVRSRLMRAALSSDRARLGTPEVVWDPGETWQLYAPRVSPDGRRIALSVFRPPGQRDIAVIDLEAQAGDAPLVDWVTDDAALDSGPTFSPDGRTVYFHSARSDIYNIYAYTLEGGSLARVTNVMTGAFSPDVSADGKRMVYLQYSTRGFDVHELALDTVRFVPVARTGDRPPREPLGVAPGSLPAAALESPPTLPSRGYSPWPSLLPRQWIILPTNDALGTVLTLATSGQDPLGRHLWTASAGFGLVSRDVNYALAYQNRQLYPTLSLSTSRSVQAAPIPARINGVSLFVAERAHRFDLDVDVPLVRALWQLQLELGYSFEHRERLTELHFRPDDLVPVIPPSGKFAGIRGGFSFNRTRRTVGAISPEYGQRFALSATVRDRWLGADYRQIFVQTSATHYQLMPWLRHHVLMLRGTVSGGYNEATHRPLHALGGPPLRDPLRDLLFGNVSAFDQSVRGFAPGTFSGDFAYTGTAEYRAPIWRIERGWSTLPVYLRTLAGAAFVDVANAGSLDTVFRAIGVGVGGELRLDFDYGFLFGATLRIGYARGLTQNGIHNVYVVVSNGF